MFANLYPDALKCRIMSRSVTSVTYQGGTSSILYMSSSFSGLILSDADVSDVPIWWTCWDLSQTTDGPCIGIKRRMQICKSETSKRNWQLLQHVSHFTNTKNCSHLAGQTCFINRNSSDVTHMMRFLFIRNIDIKGTDIFNSERLPHHWMLCYQSFSLFSFWFSRQRPLITTRHYWHYSWSQLAWCQASGQVRAQCLHETGHGTGSVMKDQDNAKTLPDFPGIYLNHFKIWVYVW